MKHVARIKYRCFIFAYDETTKPTPLLEEQPPRGISSKKAWNTNR